VINVNADAVASDRTTTESQIFDGEGEEAIRSGNMVNIVMFFFYNLLIFDY